MCGIVGVVNFKRDISEYRNVLNNMNKTLANRGPDEEGYYISKHVGLGHKRLIVIDPEGGKQPRVERYQEGTYVIVYNGQIYNAKALKKILIDKGFEFDGHSDTEVLLKSYIHFGKDVIKYLNGIFAFAIWNTETEELFIARDHLGVKPLFYTLKENTLIFASEIKAIFEYPGIKKIIDKQGISELLGIGPSHTAGTTVF